MTDLHTYVQVVLPSRTSRSSDVTRKDREGQRERDPAPTSTTSSSRRNSNLNSTSNSTALAPRQRPQTKGFYTDKGEYDDDEEEGNERV